MNTTIAVKTVYATSVKRATLACFLFAASFMANAVSAAPDTWVGNTSTTWSTAGNWSTGSIPSSGADLTFGVAGTKGSTIIANISGLSLNSITFNSSSPAYTFTGAGSVSLGLTSAITNNGTNLQTISNPFVFGGSPITVTTKSGGGNITLTRDLSGTGNLIAAGTGTLTLAPTITSTYAGGTTISGGTLLVNNATASASGVGTGAVTVNGGILAGTGKIKTTGGVTVNAGGTLASGDAQISDSSHDTVDGTHLTLNGTTTGLTFSAGSTLSVALGAGTTAGAGRLNFATPNLNSTYLVANGSVTFTPGAAIHINLVDLTSYQSTPNSLLLLNKNPYLLIQAASDSSYNNLVTTGGLDQNGYVLGVGTTTLSYTPFDIQVYNTAGTNISLSTNYTNLQLYLDNGQLEVVPEPGTWAMMLSGLALLVFIQSRRRRS